jgi:hypothetical protein
LYGWLGDGGQQLRPFAKAEKASRRSNHCRCVADHKNISKAWHTQIRRNFNPPAISAPSQPNNDFSGKAVDTSKYFRPSLTATVGKIRRALTDLD